MVTPAIPREQYEAVVKLLAAHGGNILKASRDAEALLGISAQRFETRAVKAGKLKLWWRDGTGFHCVPDLDADRALPQPALPLPDDDLPVEQLIDHMCARVIRTRRSGASSASPSKAHTR
jgi:hypothetical protein